MTNRNRLLTLAITAAALAFTSLTSPALSQVRYERKSISFVNALWLASDEARAVKGEDVSKILRNVQAQIELPRFDFNPLPQVLITDFAATANAQPSLSVDDLATLMQEKLVPPILEIVKGALPARAGELVSEEKKQLFLATKAKELGVTLEEIEKVMNSAYIYVPVLTKFSVVKEKDVDRWTCKMSGGIIWFYIDLSSGTPQVVLRIKHSTESMGYGSEAFSVESASMNFARNLQIATRSLPEFTLSAQVVEVSEDQISFNLGLKEGIGLDDPVWVGEMVSSGGEPPKFQKDGWARVRSVADNRSNSNERSTAFAIKRGDWSPGMSVIEHPRLGIDIAFKPGLFQFKSSDGYIPLFGDYIHVKEPFDGMAVGMDLDAQINIAGLTRKNGTYIIVGGHILLPPAEYEDGSGRFTDLTTSLPTVWGAHVGFFKRAYMRQLAFSYELKMGMKFYSVKQEFRYGDWFNGYTDYTLTIDNNTFGGEAAVDLEWASSPDLNFGARLGYRLYPVSDVWTYTLKPGESGDLTESGYPFPEIDHSGLTIGIYVHYTPPSLGFDPASMLQGALGK
jgi:hypothetical protein